MAGTGGIWGNVMAKVHARIDFVAMEIRLLRSMGQVRASTKERAEYLGVSETTYTRWQSREAIPRAQLAEVCVRIGCEHTEIMATRAKDALTA